MTGIWGCSGQANSGITDGPTFAKPLAFGAIYMRTHPFKPLLPGTPKKLLIGTLPPEDVQFYFSNSSNTRLWDILQAISKGSDIVGRGGNHLEDNVKTSILKELNLGITDIIHHYERDQYHSTKDRHIMPIRYNDLCKLAIENNIVELLFVYQNALKWFVHSLDKSKPIRLRQIKNRYQIGRQPDLKIGNKSIMCTLLPAPLNRGRKGETLLFKLDSYRNAILAE